MNFQAIAKIANATNRRKRDAYSLMRLANQFEGFVTVKQDPLWVMVRETEVEAINELRELLS